MVEYGRGGGRVVRGTSTLGYLLNSTLLYSTVHISTPYLPACLPACLSGTEIYILLTYVEYIARYCTHGMRREPPCSEVVSKSR